MQVRAINGAGNGNNASVLIALSKTDISKLCVCLVDNVWTHNGLNQLGLNFLF